MMPTTAGISLARIRMKDGSTKARLQSPYHPTLPAKARALGGKFGAETKAWYFDIRDEERVRTLTLEIYGVDPHGATPTLVTIRVDLDALGSGPTNGDTFWLAGREIANRRDRDREVRLGDGVVILAGGFERYGGSKRNPWLAPKPGTVLEVRDLPAPAVDALVAKYLDRPGAITVVA